MRILEVARRAAMSCASSTGIGSTGRAMLKVLAVAGLLLPLTCLADLRFDQKYIETIKKASDIAAVSVDSFGEQIDLESGSAQFRWIDIDVPGNNALPVRLQRSLVVEDKAYGGGDLPGFGIAGSIDVPYLKGVFGPDGWVVMADAPTARCTNAQYGPPAYADYAIQASDYWSGNWLHVPGEGDQAMLNRLDPAVPRPNAGAAVMTKNFWAFSCLPGTKNGYPGEAFVATSPTGERYYFDWVVNHGYPGLSKRYGNYAHSTARISRQVVFFLVSRIEDRFGNYVNYTYNGDELTGITSNDGRFINLTWTGGVVTSVTSSVGSWTYGYSDTSDSVTVTQPDGSHWIYTGTGELAITPMQSLPLYDPNIDHCPAPELSDGDFSMAVTQPSGATATFDFQVMRHFKENVPKLCNSFIDESMMSYKYLTVPNFSDSFTLVTKTITGLGLTPMQWSYSYAGGKALGFQEACEDPAKAYFCPPSKTTTVRGPNRSYKQYTFGNMFNKNYGQLLHVDEGYETGSDPDVQAVVLKSTDSSYFGADDAGTQPFAYCVGSPGAWRFDTTATGCLQPVKVRTITQDGVTFTANTTAFDVFARPTTTVRSNTLGYSRTDGTTYADNTALWVLGQTARQTSDGVEVATTTFDPATALPKTMSSFGKLQQTIGYNLTAGDQDGTVASVTDGVGNTTTVSNWHRGTPQSIAYADGTSIAGMVDDAGLISWVEDENGYRTCYDYDPMGRVKTITYPSEAQTHLCDTTSWASTTISFTSGNPAAYGVPAGHWRQTTLTGRGRKIVIFDALWRPIVEQTLDLDRVAASTSEVIKRYDATGHPEFLSYPMNTGGQADWSDSMLKGTHTEYDALDRVTEMDQDSELGVLATKTAYLSGFRTQVTNPRGFSTITGYLAFDEPTNEWPIDIDAADGKPEEIDTDILRDIFGKPQSMTRHNPAGSVAESRTYEYDRYQQLCRMTEPETGSTLMGYDGAGNLVSSAAGLPSSTRCQDSGAAAVLARQAARNYDKRNRLKSVSFPDGLADATFGYTPDGLLATSTALNGGTDVVTTSFGYNRRRLLASERLQYGTTDWSLAYAYDRNGHRATLRYPPGWVVNYAPNALGQPTQAGSYANGISYYPNGGMKQFTYANGIVHTLTQNVRGMAERSRDAYGTTAVLDDSYDYDPNGNVLGISDGLPTARGNRDMTYDGQDRLLTTTSPMFNGTVATYAYDALDNLTAVKAPGRNQTYAYDLNWRLTNVRNAASGSTEVGLGYDAQGNLTNKNGMRFAFDMANRLRDVSGSATAHYVYDAQGMRVRDDADAGSKRSFYSKEGQLLYAEDARAGSKTNYIYLNGSLVAQYSNIPPVGIPTLTVPSQSSTGSYTVSWSASPTGNRYELQEQVNGGAFALVYNGTGTSVARAKGDGSYGYRIRACIDSNCGSWSAIASIVVSQVPAGAPNLSVPTLGANGNYTISWTAVPMANRYVLAESKDGWATSVIAYDGPALNVSFGGHAAGNYIYHVRACNSAGCSNDSPDGAVQVLYAPAAPLLTAPATSYTGSYTISWSTVSNATSYKLEESVDGGANWIVTYSGTAGSVALSQRPANSYIYRVSAYNSAGWGAASAPKTVQVTLAPATAPTVTAPSINRTGSYTVSWTSVATATNYKLEEYANGGWRTLYTGNALSLAITGRGQATYRYRVTAGNAAGYGPSSIVVTNVDFRPPTPALSVSYSAGLNFTLSWTSSSTATSYALETDGLAPYWKEIYTGTALSFIQSSQPNATTWGYRISACNSYGCSDPSPVLEVTLDKETNCTTCLRGPTHGKATGKAAKGTGR
jgi:YD repeat-containing protein